MSESRTFTVAGAAATKGSTIGIWSPAEARVITRTDSARLAVWTHAVQWAAKAARVRCVPKPRAVRVEACCILPARAGEARPTRPPDIDKIARALLDALTGVAYADDAQVTELVISKAYGAAPATTITIAEAERTRR